MTKYISLFLLLSFLPLFASYTIDQNSLNLKWTAYKYTEKIGVSGTFDSIEIKSNSSDEILKAFVGSSFCIKTKSVNSNNKLRDKKLYKYFFKKFKHGDTLKAKIKKLNADGTGFIKIKMNKKKKTLPINYTLDKNTLSFDFILDLKDFKGTEAMKSINDACKILHTGSDGITKLWPTVKVIFQASVIKS